MADEQDPHALLRGQDAPLRKMDKTKAAEIARGVQRALTDMGYASLCEVTLASGRRADVFGVNDKGGIVIVEVKSSVADFRSDQKWPDYLEFCDAFYFAVSEDFPQELIPDAAGLLVADAYGAAVIRLSPHDKLNPARRRSLLLVFARLAAQRLAALEEEVEALI